MQAIWIIDNIRCAVPCIPFRPLKAAIGMSGLGILAFAVESRWAVYGNDQCQRRCSVVRSVDSLQACEWNLKGILKDPMEFGDFVMADEVSVSLGARVDKLDHESGFDVQLL